MRAHVFVRCHFGSRTILRAILKDLCRWSQPLLRCSGDPLQELSNILSVEVDDHPRVLAALSESDWDDAISKWSALAKPTTPAKRWLQGWLQS